LTTIFESSPEGADINRSTAAILSDIENESLERARQLARQYWRTGGDYELAYGEAMLAAREDVRSELLTVFGEEARRDPLFHRYFRPLDPMYAFLTSDQQLSIQQLKFERDKKLKTAMSQGRPDVQLTGTGAIDPRVVEAINGSFQAELQTLLDESALFEFQLRESPTAQQLRASRVQLTEDEFRETFSALSTLQDGPVDIEDALEGRSELRRILGTRRFAALWSARDPVYSRVLDVVARNGLDGRTADAIYEVMNDFQDRRMRAASFAGDQPDRAAAESALISEQERDSIARLVGDPIAAEVLRARAVQSYRLFGGNPPAEISQNTTLRVQ
jgi:hypothetical protein